MTSSNIRAILDASRALESVISSDLATLDLGSFDVSSEEILFTKVQGLMNLRKKFIKHSMSIRASRRVLAPYVQEAKDIYNATLVDSIPKLQGLKTKEERDAAIACFYKQAISSLPDDYLQVDKRLDQLLLDVNIVISECQKIFDAYELVYNFSKLSSMGYLLSQAQHKMSDIVKD